MDFIDPAIDGLALDTLLSGKSTKVQNLYVSIFSKVKGKQAVDLSIDENFEDDLEDAADDSASFADKWARILRKYEAVYRKAKENFDEKNIETCFLADGFVTWENIKVGPTPNAPLILHPIKIEPTARGNSDFQLIKNGDSFFNQALILLLQRDFGIDPEVFNVIEEPTLNSPAVKEIIDKLEETVTGFGFSKERILGNFSFLKYPMVQDLNRIIESNTSHLILSALAGNNESAVKLSETGSEMTFDELSELSPVVENLIFPADSSQHAAISAILGGKSVVIQGPPGSGKSQTIANLIAESIMANKKVLFVAEKRAAIDAVTERLAEKGLGGVVLDLHGEPDKKTIAQNLLSAVKTYNLPQSMSRTEEIALLQTKKRLNGRWKWLNQLSGIKGESGAELSHYEALYELGNVRAELQTKTILQANLLASLVETFSYEQKEDFSRVFQELHTRSFFDKRYQENEVIREFRNLIDPIKADLIVTNLQQTQASLESPYWKKIKSLFEKAFKVEPKNFADFKKTFSAINEHIDFTKYFEVKNLGEIESYSSSLLSLSEFRQQKQLGLIAGYFAKKREYQNLKELLKTSWTSSDRELSRLINNEVALLLKWTGEKYTTPELDELVIEFEPIVQFIDNLVQLIDRLSELVPQQIGNSELTFESVNNLLKRYLPIQDLILVAPHINTALAQVTKANLSSVLEVMLEFKLTLQESIAFWNLIWLSGHLTSELKRSTWSDVSHSLNWETENFKELDTKHLRSNSARILTHLTYMFGQLPAADKQLLVKESMKKSGHLPLRELLNRIPDSIQKIKPVMAMSPLAVSRLLPSKESMFDIVIFDEASQIKPEDAITSIFRGRQLVVAGDRFQLPPTNFGEKTLEEDINESNDSDENYVDPATIGMESILTTAIGVFASDRNIKPLRLHYRSNDERLISWSNFHIYRKAGEELFTFPSLDVESHNSLRYTYLPGVKTQSMSVANEAEIQEVKKIVLKHIKEHPDLSLGVIAFGMRHSIRLQDEFNILEKENDDFYEWKKEWSEKREKFFIKNIERVQGDERDAIIITPGYAPNLDGNVPLQFGSLNRQGGERRLNVAASRAKEYIHLVTSMRSQDIDTRRSKSPSIALLRTYLEFMENEGRLVEADYEFNVPTTPFEEEILQKLSDKGLTVDCQVGDSGFKIDFAVRDPKTNRYILAIEADGASYHSSEYARERDYMRQRILENRGWRFVRIWSTDWWQNPDQEVNRVLAALSLSPKKLSDSESAALLIPERISEKYEDIEEFKILRGLKAQNPRLIKEQLFDLWAKTMGVQRRTQHLYNRFNNYWRDLR